jgi:hypothetical protein
MNRMLRINNEDSSISDFERALQRFQAGGEDPKWAA